MCLSHEIRNFSFKAVSTPYFPPNAIIYCSNLHKSFTHYDYSPNEIILWYVHCACYIKMDDYSTPEFYKSTLLLSISLPDKPLSAKHQKRKCQDKKNYSGLCKLSDLGIFPRNSTEFAVLSISGHMTSRFIMAAG